VKRSRSIEEIGEAALGSKSNAPQVASFTEYLANHARVPLRGGAYGKFSFVGRVPLEFIADIIDKVVTNCLRKETVEIDGVTFAPGKLKGATLSVGGGAQFGKTVLVLNFQGYATFIEFVNFGYYTPDQELLAKIVDTKFRPDVLDQNPWMAEMVSVGKAENASGKTVNRKNSYQASDGQRKAFGHFCGMQKPPTTISLDAAALDEVDDIPAKNLGYVDGRMTGSPLQFKLEIGTQRIAGAGQNARVKAGSFHVRMYECVGCGKSWNLEENFPQIIRKDGVPIKAEDGHDRNGHYYCACPECGAEIDRDAGRYIAKNPHRIKDAHISVRVSQLNISAVTLQEFVGAWYAAMEDPTGGAMVAFYCDRVAIPNAGSAQPIVQKVLDDCRALGYGSVTEQHPFNMSLSPIGLAAMSPTRVAGMDMGPRCWFWCDEIVDKTTSALVWSELIGSGSAPTRVPLLMQVLGISCAFFDAGGEPDLTKRLVLSLNGLEDYTPPQMPRSELLKSHLNIGKLRWDGERAKWHGLRGAAVMFVAGESKGVEQSIGFTQEGRIFPLIKCNRGESIQAAVNDFLTPAEGVLDMIAPGVLRTLPRARLPQNCIGSGVSQAVLDSHLMNLRKERNVQTGAEDWVDQVENHLGLAKVYARLASTVATVNKVEPFSFRSVAARRPDLWSNGRSIPL